jgi:hypothetical protein
MKKIFPIVVRPVNRFGVPARRRLMPAVERGKVNQAQVKLSNFWCQLVVLLACTAISTHCLSLLIKLMLSSERVSLTSAMVILPWKLQVGVCKERDVGF